jgi:hypothetical protein
MGDAARLSELVEREVGAFVSRVEALGAHVDGVRAIGDGSADGVERAGWGEELGDAAVCHKR